MMKSIKKVVRFLLNNLQRKTVILAEINQISPNTYLKDRCALVTGATSGIGLAIADAMCASGSDVILLGRNKDRLDKVTQDLKSKHPSRLVIDCLSDISDIDETSIAVSEILNFYHQKSGKHVSILVNNAGAHGGLINTTNEEEYDNIMNTNLKGVFFLSRLFAKELIKHNIKGNILNIASSSSLRPSVSAYMLSKRAIVGLTEGLAKSLISHDIVVNAIAPGPTATKMTMSDQNSGLQNPKNPLGRYALPEEIANMSVILTSNLGRTIVGTTVYMTGGAGTITNDDANYELF